jgi:Dyp-type peroxidase family
VTDDTREKLETRDIQGLVTRGFGSLAAARFLLLEVCDAALARSYLRSIAGRVNTAHAPAEHYVVQVAFTAPGLEQLGVPKPIRDTFAREFLEGMDDEVRAESLGDRGDNDPSKWEWGRGTRVHVLVMLYAQNETTLQHHLVEELAVIEAGAFRVVHKETTMLRDQKEHFGWADGLSMPVIEGVPKERPRKKRPEWWTTPIKPGEFVLGYRNEYDCFSESPTVELADDPGGMLPPTPDGTRKDLGRNGTYLIYREMTQDVIRFWDHLATESREPGEDLATRAIALGSKMVGRWPGGAPISTIDRDDLRHAKDNTFTYASDLVGLGCPLGAHIRRANPRANLAADRSEGDSIEMVRKHQMIRRGRAFGRPVVESMDPREILAARGRPDSERRGLHFICLVGHISRQFEFVQRAWIHSANFLGLYKDGDPISAARRRDGNANDEFTCPAEPLRRKYKALPRFTQLVGGAYFFLPGIRALRFIAREP